MNTPNELEETLKTLGNLGEFFETKKPVVLLDPDQIERIGIALRELADIYRESFYRISNAVTPMRELIAVLAEEADQEEKE